MRLDGKNKPKLGVRPGNVSRCHAEMKMKRAAVGKSELSGTEAGLFKDDS